MLALLLGLYLIPGREEAEEQKHVPVESVSSGTALPNDICLQFIGQSWVTCHSIGVLEMNVSDGNIPVLNKSTARRKKDSTATGQKTSSIFRG
jgi:hypothetical protein